MEVYSDKEIDVDVSKSWVFAEDEKIPKGNKEWTNINKSSKVSRQGVFEIPSHFVQPLQNS